MHDKWQTVVRSRILPLKGAGWWAIALSCGHECMVLHGSKDPVGEQCQCHWCHPVKTETESPSPEVATPQERVVKTRNKPTAAQRITFSHQKPEATVPKESWWVGLDRQRLNAEAAKLNPTASPPKQAYRRLV